MQNNNTNTNTILIVLLIIIVVALGTFWYKGMDAEPKGEDNGASLQIDLGGKNDTQ
ncbi:MAG: hypothetical protein QG568_420 [Patescibacteria group bacterium]|nr:hypothetical protein [Patescibacteria group bacterium]